MNFSPEFAKKLLMNSIDDLAQSFWQFSKKPTHFSRNRKISFKDTILSTIALQKSSQSNEAYNYFKFKPQQPTRSALIQQRKKIPAEAFESLFMSFTDSLPRSRTLKGYELIAVDGSDIYIPRNPDDASTYRITDKYNKGFNMIHLNAAYDLLSHLYTDIILQPQNNANEYLAMCDIIDRHTELHPDRKTLFIADRGYVSFNVFAHAIESGAFFLIRARDTGTRNMLSTLELPDSTEFEMSFERLLTRRNTNQIKEHPEVYKSIGSRTFDYLEPKSKGIYPVSFRIVRFKLPNGNTETIYTNLPDEDFNSDELRNLYNMRWGIETSFRNIKYAAGLLYFHSKQKELILQEIYAKVILYNYCELIINEIVVPSKKKECKYIYKVNFNHAVPICIDFLVNPREPVNVIEDLCREAAPIRPNRCSPRYLRARTAVSFLYR